MEVEIDQKFKQSQHEEMDIEFINIEFFKVKN